MAADETRIPTNPFDYDPPRNYIRILFSLPLKPGVDDKIVFDDLLEALHKTFVQEPWVSDKVFCQASQTSGWRPGQLDIRHRSYPQDGSRPQLKACGIPCDIFPEQLLLEAPRIGDMDVAGADIFLAQANFLPGGLLLGTTAFHGAMNTADGSMHSKDPNDQWLRSLVGLDSDYPGEDITGATQTAAVTQVQTQGEPVPPRHPRTMLNRVRFLSRSDLATLHRECLAEPLPKDTSPLSVRDAINALLWRGVVRARAAAAEARSAQLHPISVFESPVDVRNLFAADAPQSYLSNCLLLNTARMPLAELMSPNTPLSCIAQTIREGAARLTQPAVYDAYALLRSADLSRMQGRFVERAESSNPLVSNIIFFPMSEINLAVGSLRMEGYRQPCRSLHGLFAPYVRLGHVLPNCASDGGAEMSVNLCGDDFGYLRADDEFSR